MQIDWIAERVVSINEEVTIGKGVPFADLDNTNDIALSEDDPLKAQMMMGNVAYYSAMVGLGISPIKTKVISGDSQNPLLHP